MKSLRDEICFTDDIRPYPAIEGRPRADDIRPYLQKKESVMRKSGILMHISSLPGPYGIGSMGKAAYEFVDFLQAAGQTYWQLLPLSPTGCGNSPYQSFSAFAGNPYLIDLEDLMEQGLLTRQEVDSVCWASSPQRVDFGTLYRDRIRLLRLAFERFVPGPEYERFVAEEAPWLEDYALFMVLKDRSEGKTWQQWSLSLMMRLPELMEQVRQEQRRDMEFRYFHQYIFFRQWRKLKEYANSRGIRIIGDAPIYVPLDSADVWANPHLFQLDGSGRPAVVAGCPPDSFSADGQLWGNPIYDWEAMKKEDYGWWIRRLEAASRMYDVVRLDHFRGFESYWAVPEGAETAAAGSWKPGPGMAFLETIRQKLPHLELIAEDLGYVTPQVRWLQEQSGWPGMKVIQFAFDSREEGNYLPHTYPVRSVCYSGTHDNPTLVQWLGEALPEDVTAAQQYLGLNRQEGTVRGLLRGCMGSMSELCIVQLQDWLELGREARMNTPGTLSDLNWTWRAEEGCLTEELAQRIREMTVRYGRI